MPKYDKRVDAYIAKAPDYAKPILKHLREVVHEACPECEETLKWSTPTFTYHGILCGMAAFKDHCNFVLWKGQLIKGADIVQRNIKKVSDLPSKKALTNRIRKAMALNEAGVKVPRTKPGTKKPLAMPMDFSKAIKKSRKAATAFEKFSPSHKREYIEWINDAKRPETRTKRIATAVGWIAAGKPRNWQYM
jgi:uncharacterized protein YdeI (YjbR/CyaY-like superfamily)